jgi:DNA-binding Lrp family transcriptional regulator
MAVKHMAMDELGRKILHPLQIDGERPLVARGRAVGLSVSAVNERIKNLNRRVR